MGHRKFDAPSITDPLYAPKALVTGIFRPFPWEAHNAAALMQAVDGVLLIGLMLWRAPSIGRAFRYARSNPFVIFIIVFTLMMTVALVSFANFGTLARYRVMLIPFLLMLMAFVPNNEPQETSLPEPESKLRVRTT